MTKKSVMCITTIKNLIACLDDDDSNVKWLGVHRRTVVGARVWKTRIPTAVIIRYYVVTGIINSNWSINKCVIVCINANNEIHEVIIIVGRGRKRGTVWCGRLLFCAERWGCGGPPCWRGLLVVMSRPHACLESCDWSELEAPVPVKGSPVTSFSLSALR